MEGEQKKNRCPFLLTQGHLFFQNGVQSNKEWVVPFPGDGTGRPVPWQYLHLIRQLQKPSAALLDLFIGTPDQVSAADAPGKKGIAGKHELTFLVIETESTGSMAWSMHDQQMTVLQILAISQKTGGIAQETQALVIALEKAGVETDLLDAFVACLTQEYGVLFRNQHFKIAPDLFQVSYGGDVVPVRVGKEDGDGCDVSLIEMADDDMCIVARFVDASR